MSHLFLYCCDRNAVKEGMGKLWPFSPSEAGVDVGKGLMEGMQHGVEAGRAALVAQLAAVAKEAAQALQGGSRQEQWSNAVAARMQAMQQALTGLQGVGGGNRDAAAAFLAGGGGLQSLFGRGSDFAPMLGAFRERLRQMGLRLLDDWRVVPAFDKGGTVPGPLGAPRLVMAHGGETITPAGRGGIHVAVNVQGGFFGGPVDASRLGRIIGRQVQQELARQ